VTRALQDDKCTTASTLVRAVEKLAPCPGWHASASAAAAGDAAPACALCRMPVVSSLDFRHSACTGAAGEEVSLCYSCKVTMLAWGLASCALLEVLTRSLQTLHMHDAAAVASLMRDLCAPQPPRRMSEQELRQQVQEFLLDDGE
jgi:hypothetical protein